MEKGLHKYSFMEIVVLVGIATIVVALAAYAMVRSHRAKEIESDLEFCYTLHDQLSDCKSHGVVFQGTVWSGEDGVLMNMSEFCRPGVTYSMEYVASILPDDNAFKTALANTFGCSTTELVDVLNQKCQSSDFGEYCYQFDKDGTSKVYVWINQSDMSVQHDIGYNVWGNNFADASPLVSSRGTTLIHVYG